MNDETKQDESSAKTPFIKPELKSLEVKDTRTGPNPDPTEFPGILNMSWEQSGAWPKSVDVPDIIRDEVCFAG